VPAAVAAALLMAWLASPALADGGPTARISHGTALPFRTLVLNLPSTVSLDPQSVQVYENGQRVSGVQVIPAAQADSSQFGVVLVLDASKSMTGQPAAAALAAAQRFAQAVSTSSQLAVVTFNSSTQVLLPLTRDQTAVTSALTTPMVLQTGTHIYDGVKAGLDVLAAEHIKNGSIVVLSDGADTGSTASESGIAALAKKAGVRIYTVGLRSKAFDRTTLEQLAQDGGGSYSEATSSAELSAVYGRLGQEVANQYVIRYRTSQPAGTYVHVAVRMSDLGVAETGYHMPAGAPQGAFHRSVWVTFWRSLVGMMVAVILSAALVGAAVYLVIRPGPSRLRARVGQFVSVQMDRERSTRTTPLLTERLAAGAERSFGRAGFWTRFKRDLELAEIHVPPGQILLATAIGVALVGWVLATLTGVPFVGLAGLLVILIPRSIVNTRLSKRREAFAEQLPDNLQVMASAMRAGHSFVGALSVVVEDSPEPSKSEFGRVVADEQFGVSLAEALGRAVERMDNRDLSQVALVAAMQRDTGGNTAEVLDRVTETIRERFALRRLVKTLTAQGRMSRWIVSILPVALLGIITALNPSYMAPLFDRQLGRVLLVVASVLVISGSLVIKRIVNIKV
jgi:tight adherence protein B